MSTVTMNMSGYEIESNTTAESNNADWQHGTTMQQYSDIYQHLKPMPADLISVDVNAFMLRMNRYQRS